MVESPFNGQGTEEQESASRRRIFDAADRLFRRYGYQAVGVDRIVEESGVAKMTLYRQFTSKDNLIVTFLETEDATVRRWVKEATDGCESPRARLQYLFKAIEARTADPSCHGCPFQLAFAEFPDPAHPVHKAARVHKERLRETIGVWISEAGFRDVKGTTNQLVMLMEGAWAAARGGYAGRTGNGIAWAATLIVEGGLYAEALDSVRDASNTKSDR